MIPPQNGRILLFLPFLFLKDEMRGVETCQSVGVPEKRVVGGFRRQRIPHSERRHRGVATAAGTASRGDGCVGEHCGVAAEGFYIVWKKEEEG